MRILHSPEVDLVVLDTTLALRETHETIKRFLRSADEELRLSARTDGSPAPYDEFLPCLDVVKKPGLIMVEKPPTGGIRVTGPEDLLLKWIEAFLCSGDQVHRHPEQEFHPGERAFENGSLYPYIQADDDYEKEGYAFNA